MDGPQAIFRIVRLARACRWPVRIFLFGASAGLLGYWNAFPRGLSELPWQIQWLVWAMLIVAVLTIVVEILLATCGGWRDSFEGYRNRVYLERARGSMEDELKKARESIWIYWDNGATAQNHEVFANEELAKKIKKMIIMGESNPAIDEMLRLDTGRSKDLVLELIRTTTRGALDAGIDIRHLERSVRLPPMILIDHRSHWGWIRFEAAWPGMKAEDRPSIVIKKRQFKPLFKTIKRSYDTIFRSLPPLKHETPGGSSLA